MKKIILFLILTCGFYGGAVEAQDTGQQFEGFNLEGYTEGGEKAWNVTGDTADFQGDLIAISNVDANRFGEQEMNLKARTGVIDKVSGNIHLEEDVVITAKSGGQLKTDSLDWQKEKDLVSTDAPVELTDEGLKATGTGLQAHPGLKTAQMNKDVTVQVNTEPKKVNGQVVTVTCDGPMEMDQNLNKAVFTDNVVAVQEGRTLKADKMEMFFDPESQEIRKVICTGHVEIQQGDNTSYSSRAVYDGKTGKLTLTGRPKLIMVTEGESGMGSFME